MNLNAKNYNTQLRVHKSPTQPFRKKLKSGADLNSIRWNSISTFWLINYLKNIQIKLLKSFRII